MKILFLTSIIFLFNCQKRSSYVEIEKSINKANTTAEVGHQDSIPLKHINSKESTIECNCDIYKIPTYKDAIRSDLTFINNDPSHKNDSVFLYFSRDDLRLKIKSIKLSCYDTIPEQLKIFENTEHVIIADSRKEIVGLEIFPKLKSVYFWASAITFNSHDKWLKNIEAIFTEKTLIKGWTSFSFTPNLKTLEYAGLRMEPFPSDIDQVKCLRKIRLFAYMDRNVIDLSKLDLKQNPCLEEVEFHTWYDSFSGIPRGIDPTRNFKINIYHQRMTQAQKKKISEFKKNNGR